MSEANLIGRHDSHAPRGRPVVRRGRRETNDTGAGGINKPRARDTKCLRVTGSLLVTSQFSLLWKGVNDMRIATFKVIRLVFFNSSTPQTWYNLPQSCLKFARGCLRAREFHTTFLSGPTLDIAEILTPFLILWNLLVLRASHSQIGTILVFFKFIAN